MNKTDSKAIATLLFYKFNDLYLILCLILYDWQLLISVVFGCMYGLVQKIYRILCGQLAIANYLPPTPPT